jgi:hypothetical protein
METNTKKLNKFYPISVKKKDLIWSLLMIWITEPDLPPKSLKKNEKIMKIIKIYCNIDIK